MCLLCSFFSVESAFSCLYLFEQSCFPEIIFLLAFLFVGVCGCLDVRCVVSAILITLCLRHCGGLWHFGGLVSDSGILEYVSFGLCFHSCLRIWVMGD